MKEHAVEHFYKTLALRNQDIIAKQYAEIQAWKREYKRLFWLSVAIAIVAVVCAVRITI